MTYVVADYSKYKNHKQYFYVYTISDYEKYTDLLLNNDSDLAADTETYVLRKYLGKGGSAFDCHAGRISLLILKPRNHKPIIFDLILLERQDYDRTALYHVLNSKKLLFYFAQFDLKFLKKSFGKIFPDIICLNYAVRLITNATGSKFAKQTGGSLKDILRELFNIRITGKKKEQADDWYPRPELDNEAGLDYWFEHKLTYAASDTLYLHKVADELIPTICNPLYKTDLIQDGTDDLDKAGLGMQWVFDLDMEMCRIAAEMEYNGLPASKEIFDDIRLKTYNEELQEGEMVEAATNLCDVLKLPTVDCLWTDDRVPAPDSWKTINSNTKIKPLINKLIGTDLDAVQGAQLLRIVTLLDQLEEEGSFELINEAEEVAYKELQNIEKSLVAETSKAIQTLLRYKKLAKNYSMNLGKHINTCTGFIHARYHMLGTATGRSSASPVQQVSSRTTVEIERPLDNLFPSSARIEMLEPDWRFKV